MRVVTTLVLAVLAATPVLAQQSAAERLLDQVATAMGGRQRLLDMENFVYTGFGQQLYQDGGGNVTGDLNAPPKWRGLIDVQRTFDLKGQRAVNQQRGSDLFPFAAPMGLSWDRSTSLQTGVDTLDHPLSLVRAALDPAAKLGPVTVEEGQSVLQFTTADGTTLWMAADTTTHLPTWMRRIVPHVNLGDVAVTTYFTGYVPNDGIPLPFGLMKRIDWRQQITLMFQVDSYRLNVLASELPAFPAPPAPRTATAAVAVVTPLAKGVWDVRVG
ncbi:MAG: hypothetical protein LBE59_08535, partial [Nevskiaceae bacterium]|nr:hypothetical protein [Nevskiaceae bacterium]